MRQNESMACPAASNDSTSTEQHSVGPCSVSSIATGSMVNITDNNTTVHDDIFQFVI